MKNFLKKMILWMNKHQKMLGLSLFMILLLVPKFAFADDAATTSTSAADTSQMVKDMADFLSIVIQFLNSLLWPFLIILGDLMDVDIIIGPGMGDRMIAINNAVRNLVNIAFVLFLIVVAFYNVLGIGGGEGELAIKTALPKVVLGLILVNFTLPIGRVLLDLSNVGTNIAFGLPNVIEGYKFEPALEQFTNEVCYKEHYIDTETNAEVWTFYQVDDTENTPIQTELLCQDSDGDGLYDSLSSTISTTYFSDLNKNNLGLIIAVNMGKLGALNILKQGSVTTFDQLTVNMIFSTLMYFIFAISYIVMGVVLLVRDLFLWIALALSPIGVLTYVIPQVKEWMGSAGDATAKVIKHLIAPMMFGVTLSLGYLLMDAWNSVSQGASNAFNSLAVNSVISNEFLVSGIDDLPKLILAVASIVVVWTGVFAAANDTYAQSITDGIKGFGDQIKDFAFKLPMSLPFVPIDVKGENPEAGKISPMALKLWADSALSSINNGSWAQEQLNNLPEGTNIAGLPMNMKGHTTTPDTAKSALRAFSNDTSTRVDFLQAKELADHLMTMARSKGDPGKVIGTLQTYKERLDRKDATAYEDLKRLVNQNQEKPENFGMDLETWTPLLASIEKKTVAATTSTDTGAGTPPPAVAPLSAPVITNVTSIVNATDFQGARTGLEAASKAAPSDPDLSKGAADLKAADDAVKALATTNTAKSVDDARKAVDAALASVGTLQSTTKETAIKGHTDAAIPKLNELKTKLATP